MMASLFSILTLVAALAQTSVGDEVTLIRVSPSGWPVCPGDDVVYNCTSKTTFYLWREISPAGKLLEYLFPFTHNSTGNFIIKFLTLQSSSATLRGALLSHNNLTIGCSFGTIGEFPNETVVVAGASTPPSSLTFTSINATSALLTWQPPLIESKCSFTYAINISNGSVVDYRSRETSSLIISHLNIGEKYYFAVAVEDVNSNKGPWSDTTSIFWQVPQAVLNLTLRVLHSNVVQASWKFPADNSHPPVLCYTVTHNITVSGDMMVTKLNVTNEAIFHGVQNGYSYRVSIAAMNIIGVGELRSGVVSKNYPSFLTVPEKPNEVSSYFDYSTMPSSEDNVVKVSTLSKTTASMSIQSAIHIESKVHSETPVPTGESITTVLIVVPVVVITAVLTLLLISVVVCLVRWKGLKVNNSNRSGDNKIELQENSAYGPIIANRIEVEINAAYGQVLY